MKILTTLGLSAALLVGTMGGALAQSHGGGGHEGGHMGGGESHGGYMQHGNMESHQFNGGEHNNVNVRINNGMHEGHPSFTMNRNYYSNHGFVRNSEHGWNNGVWNRHYTYFGGYYGFWFPYGGTDIFVNYDNEDPNSCNYWNGSEWVILMDSEGFPFCP